MNTAATATASTLRLHKSTEDFIPLMERLDALTPLFKAHGEANEELGRVTPEVEAALHASGVFRIGIPANLGGYELIPRQVIEVIEKISYADASTGWTVMALQVITGTTAAYLGQEAADEMFANDNYSLTAGQATRMGVAKKVDGGFRITGSWSFASGVPLATYIHTAAFCAETGQALVFTFPKELCTVVNNWDVMGLRATGSHDYICEDLFVPDSHVYEATTMDAHNGGAVYRAGLANLAGICHVGWGLGVARRLLDEMKALAISKTGMPGTSVDTQQYYAEYAEAESKIRAARAWLMEVWADNEATLDAGELLNTEQETLTRLSLNNLTWRAEEVGQMVHKWAATAAVRRGDMQRFFRDLNTGSAHITSSPGVLQGCGKKLSGLAPNAEWVFLELQDK